MRGNAVTLVAVCGVAFGLGVTGVAAAAPTGDEAQLRALEARYVAAFTAENVDALMDNYARGSGLFVFDATPPRQHVGWDDYKKDWQALFAQFPGHAPTKMTDLSLTIVGPVAYGHNIQTTDFATRTGGKARYVVRVTDVFRKLKGEWKIVQEHVSFPVDLSTGKADLLSTP